MEENIAVKVSIVVMAIPIRASRSVVGRKNDNQVMRIRNALGIKVCIMWKFSFLLAEIENSKIV